jgi:omega-6 fatty acid desaturase (delta-12 desaturase)
MATNAAIISLVGGLATAAGIVPFLAVHMPVTIIAATIGVWLFYVQHQFGATYWAKSSHWTPESAALFGSSYLILPQPFRWLTANIGLHHIHHLSSGIPFYRLVLVLRDWPELEQNVPRLGIRDGMRALKLALWDETSQELVSFRRSRGQQKVIPEISREVRAGAGPPTHW